MKMFSNQIEMNANTKLSFALCTVLALSGASLRANEPDKDKGAPGAASKTEAGRASQLNSADEQFIKEACKANKIELKMSKLGVQKAQNEQVKQFAQKLIDDHTKANTELKQLASRKGLMLPESDESLTGHGDEDRTRVREKTDADRDGSKEHAEFKAEWKKLEDLSGTEFDRQYVGMAVKCHEKSVQEFEKASQRSGDPEVKAFAAKTVPTLREHLSQAKSLQTTVSGVGAPGSDSNTDYGKSKSDSDSPKP
ncbi:MAG TPA: DUF4142 domain-containing protein [Methylomirabilota bacterium]|nr:DUF4142 domain-containing protein [Methylomirabilota bacterium]